MKQMKALDSWKGLGKCPFYVHNELLLHCIEVRNGFDKISEGTNVLKLSARQSWCLSKLAIKTFFFNIFVGLLMETRKRIQEQCLLPSIARKRREGPCPSCLDLFHPHCIFGQYKQSISSKIPMFWAWPYGFPYRLSLLIWRYIYL